MNRTKWKRADTGDGVWAFELRAAAMDGTPVLMFIAHAREGSWDVQDARGHVFAHAAGNSLEDSQSMAYMALLRIVCDLRSTIG